MSTRTPNHLGEPEAAAVPARQAFDEFLRGNPDYATTAEIDERRRTDYARLDDERHTYLDYTGGSLHGASQVAAHLDVLTRAVFGNPHSANPASSAMTTLIERARRKVLEYFHA